MSSIPTATGTKRSLIGKEVFIGLLALGLGTFNLLKHFGVIEIKFTAPELAANILLALSGLFILLQAFKLARQEFHKRGLF